MGTRLALVDKPGALCTAMNTFIEGLPGIERVTRIEDPRRLPPLMTSQHPEIIVLSTALMGEGLLPAITQIADMWPDAKVLVASADNDSRLALRALEAGARGYLLVDHAVEELERAIDTLLRNRTYLSPGIAGVPRHSKPGAGRDRSPVCETPMHGGLSR